METKHWLIDFRNDWKQLFGKYNWYTFTVIQLDFEKENMAYGYEFNFVLLGLGVYIRYNTDKSHEQFAKWSEDAKDAKPIEDLINEDAEPGTDYTDLIDEYSETWKALGEYDNREKEVKK